MPQAETTAWAAAVIGDGGTVSSNRRVVVDNLIAGLKADGVFSKLDRLWLFKAENSQSALRDLTGGNAATPGGSPTFVAESGYTGGTNKYISSNFNPTTAPSPKFVQDSCTLFSWELVSAASDGPQIGMEAGGSSSFKNRLFHRWLDDKWYSALNDVNSVSEFGVIDASGLRIITRNASTDIDAYKNGAYFDNNVISSATVPNETFLFLNEGNLAENHTGRLAIGGFGQGLTAQNAADLYKRLNTYMVATGAYEAETIAWENAVIVDGGTVSLARRILVNDLIAALKNAGIFTKLDRLWLLRAENSQSALRDIVTASAATAVNSPTFKTNLGYLAVATSYIDTNFNPATALSPKFTRDSAHLSLWNNTHAATTIQAAMGQGDGNNIYIKLASDGLTYFRLNDATDSFGYATPNPMGLLLGNRSGSNDIEGYQNGAALGAWNFASKAVANSNIAILSRFDFGTAAMDTFHQIGAASIGGSLTSTEVANLYTHLNTYMSAVDRLIPDFAGFSTPQADGLTIGKMVGY